MHFSSHRFSLFLGIALLLLTPLIAWQKHSCSDPEKRSAHKSLSLVAPAPGASKKKSSLSCVSGVPKSSLHGTPAPLQHPSEEELRFYPGAVVIEAAEIEGSDPHQKIRLRILKTDFKSSTTTCGLIRTEECVDEKSGELVSRGEMLADHLLVSLPAGEDPQHFLERLGRTAYAISKVTQDGSLHDVTLRSGSLNALPEALETIATIDGAHAEPNWMAHASSSNIPSYFSSCYFLWNQWGLWENGGGIDAYNAWQVEPGAPSVIVAVIDSGIRYTHEDLAGNMWSDPAEVKEGNLHGIDTIDENENSMDLGITGHGTHVAGIIGGMGVSKYVGLEHGTFGVAPQVQLMACRYIDNNGVGDEKSLITCMDYAIRHGATILNCSSGLTTPYDPAHCRVDERSKFYDSSYHSSYSTSLFQACQKAQEAGVIIVAAAGNAAHTKKTYSSDSGRGIVRETQAYNNDEHPFYPASYNLDNIISVAASTFSQWNFYGLSPDSNYGPHTVQIAAPGCDILSTSNQSNSSYIAYSGTSMATPFVTGSLALLKEHYPHASYQALIKHLLANADQIQALEDKIIDGRHLNIGKALQTPLME